MASEEVADGLEEGAAGSEAARTTPPPSAIVANSSGRSGFGPPTRVLQIIVIRAAKNASSLAPEAAWATLARGPKYITWQGLSRLERRCSGRIAAAQPLIRRTLLRSRW